MENQAHLNTRPPSGLPTAKKKSPFLPGGPGEAVMLKFDTGVVFGLPWAAGWLCRQLAAFS